MNIQVIRDIGELMQYKDSWDGLLQENRNDNPYITLDWITCWWSFFNAGRELYVIVLTDEDHAVGFCPLMLVKKNLHTEVKFIGHPQAGRMGFIMQRSYEKPFIRLAIEHLLSIGGSVVVNLHGLNRDDPCLALMKDAIAGRTYYVRTLPSCIISLKKTRYDQFFESRKCHNTINQTFIREKKLAKVCSLAFEKSKIDDVEKIFTLHEKRWLKKFDENGFGKGVSKEFFMHLASKAVLDSLLVQVYLLKAGQSLIGFAYGIGCNGRFVFYRIAHDDDFAVYKPGMILLKKVIEECFAQGYSTFDFSTGDEPYKKYWTDEIELVDCIRFGTETIVTSTLLFAGHLGYSLRALLKKNTILVRFKRVTLGRIRYIFSRASILSLWKRVQSVLYRETAGSLFSLFYMMSSALWEKLFGSKEYVYQVNPITSPSEIKPAIMPYLASLDDLPLLSDLMNCNPEDITRRYFKGQRCQVFLRSDKPVGYAWITNAQIIKGNRILWSPAKTGDCCYHELHVFWRFGDMHILRAILVCLSYQQNPSTHSGLYLMVGKADRRLISVADDLFLRLSKSPVSCHSKDVCLKDQSTQVK